MFLKALYVIWQCTWGFLQTLMGFAVFVFHAKCKHFLYHGAVFTVWENSASVSLGLFVFVSKRPSFARKHKDKYTENQLFDMLVVHEYGHTIQSLILGPLYLIIVGIPSSTWAGMPYLVQKRKREGISYFDFFTESNANYLGEKVTKSPSPGKLLID